MAKVIRAGVVLALTSCLSFSSSGEEPWPANEKVTIDFRWIEPRVIKGQTEETGHQVACGGEPWYASLKPVLTSQDIASAKLATLRFANVNQYGVKFVLTDEALKKLAEGCGDEPGRSLTVYVNGRWYGSSYFNKARPKAFTPPMAGFMLSKERAEQILKASRRPILGPLTLRGAAPRSARRAQEFGWG